MLIITLMNCVKYVHMDIITRISKTWLTSFPLISMPFISNISSPSDRSPLRSAAPPRTMRLITTLSISLRTVAPYRRHTERQMDMTVIYCILYTEDNAFNEWICYWHIYIYLKFTYPDGKLKIFNREQNQCVIFKRGPQYHDNLTHFTYFKLGLHNMAKNHIEIISDDYQMIAYISDLWK